MDTLIPLLSYELVNSEGFVAVVLSIRLEDNTKLFEAVIHKSGESEEDMISATIADINVVGTLIREAKEALCS